MYNISHLLWYKRIPNCLRIEKRDNNAPSASQSSYFEQRFSLTSLIDYRYVFTAPDVYGIFGYLFQRPNFE